jgi:hypothetical protein
MDASSNEQLSSQLEDEEEFCHLKRRFRTNFNDAQTALLERTFVNTHYPDQQTKRGKRHFQRESVKIPIPIPTIF